MRDTTDTPATDAPAQTAGSTGGLNLSAASDSHAGPPSSVSRRADRFSPARPGLSGVSSRSGAVANCASTCSMNARTAASSSSTGAVWSLRRALLKTAAERGELVYRDNGPHSVYVHPDHA
ncbi:hypothetical protein [Streptomyces sp. NBC_01637]|uniref:hypothetical protein n=1 Tax=unclassified Streptomyces TaxID=2593676 RepID=UPI00386DC6B9|nr:hypothetical protein OH719_23300 [Streptomyces sp. NBC_01653]WTD34928.1 hypothetical protein OHB03_23390 [Streptomyces sp. NBC_01643]WTD90334.1 hypothetical protein OG891_23575 [Streptomyces sp. NBC_01637]